MTEFELKDKIKELKKEIKEINPKYTKKIAEKKAILKELNDQLKEMLKNVPVLNKETIELINVTLAEDNYWEDIENVTQRYIEESDHNFDVSREAIDSIENSIYVDKSLYHTLDFIYKKDVDNRRDYKNELNKLVKKAVKRITKTFKFVVIKEKFETMVTYTKITKKDLFELLYSYSILGTVSDNELYNYINRYMIAR